MEEDGNCCGDSEGRGGVEGGGEGEAIGDVVGELIIRYMLVSLYIKGDFSWGLGELHRHCIEIFVSYFHFL